LQSLARSGIVAPNNSFKPKPLRGSATPCGFSGGFGLTQALALMKNSAVISDCEQYRYELRRVWDESAPLVLFIGLNPSTADGSSDDNTSRVCIKSGGAMAVFCLATCLPTARPTSLPFTSRKIRLAPRTTLISKGFSRKLSWLCALGATPARI
jgi:hypothetical protein